MEVDVHEEANEQCIRAKEKCRESKGESENKLRGLSRYVAINSVLPPLPPSETCLPLGFCRDIVITSSAGFCS